MTLLLASVRLEVGALALAGILTSCAGTKTERTDETATIKTPPGYRVTVTVRKDETIVESTPIPIWESLISGVTGGLVNAFKPEP
jgi:hypothetical protein